MQSKTALITGSTSGIGLGIAQQFAKAGYQIAMHGLEKNGTEIAAQIAQETGVRTTFSSANLMYSDQVYSMVKQAEEDFGGVDILINNAGVQFVSPIEDFPIEKWDMIIAINLSATFHASKAVWKGMKQRQFGRIINIASVHGLRASEYKSAYIAAKHGVVGLTKTLALEGANVGITCNAICPGYVKTPLVEGQIADQAKAHNMSEADVIKNVMLKKQAIKDFVGIDELANLALLLAAPESKLFTGAIIPVDGGWTVQ